MSLICVHRSAGCSSCTNSVTLCLLQCAVSWSTSDATSTSPSHAPARTKGPTLTWVHLEVKKRWLRLVSFCSSEDQRVNVYLVTELTSADVTGSWPCFLLPPALTYTGLSFRQMQLRALVTRPSAAEPVTSPVAQSRVNAYQNILYITIVYD
jgi:hypothetical protein